jgi:hypothetical protein
VRIPVFLSYPKPCLLPQQRFVERVVASLQGHGFEARTLGVTDYDMDAPLRAIRRLMLESNGLITIALRRTFVERGTSRFRTDIAGLQPSAIDGAWLTSPWAHIEPAMAYQLGLPVLIFREKGVMPDGILEKGIVGLYMPECDPEASLDDYFASPEWSGIIGKWEGYVRRVVERKGNPPELY